MHDSIADLLPILDQALADCRGVVSEPELEPIARARARVESRLRRPDDVLLVALAGGTGSGKSSLFNAFAGDEMAVTGGTRPTTSQPLALVPERRSRELAGYLDAAGVENRIVVPGQTWLCLIDLPDTDSVVVDHRLRVDGLLPVVDVVVWVVDPEKYRDAALHHGLIAPLAAYARQFVFALNQVDRLGKADAAQVEQDLGVALAEDGVLDAAVFPVAARPQAGPALGIDALLTQLRGMLDSGAVDSKMVSDLEAAASRLAEHVGSSGVDFEARWAALESRVAGADPSERAAIVGDLIDDLADEVGGPTADRLRELGLRARSALVATRPAEQTTTTRRKRWFTWGRRHQGSQELEPTPAGRTPAEAEIATTAREILGRRARAQATIAQLSLELRSLSQRGA
jgi:hypothetical protein